MTVWIKQPYLFFLKRPHLIDLNCVAEEQGVLLLLLLGVFVDQVGEAQADAQHHA